MQAHKLVEALGNMKTMGIMPPKVVDMAMTKITESVKFEFDFGDFPVFDRETMDEHVAKLKLPYPLCYFEVPNSGAILAFQAVDSPLIPLILFLKHPEKGWMVLPPSDCLCIDTETSKLVCLSDDPEVQRAFKVTIADEKETAIITALPSFVIRGLAVMNCSNVVCVDNEPPAALNKKRSKSGKVPLFSYKTLHIKIDESKTAKGGTAGDRHGPRLHLRRGHVRRLSPTRTTWVSSCVVGDKQRGIVMKDYRVTR
jgi:hypothetical protein